MKLEKLQEVVKMRSFLPLYCGIEYNTTTKNKMRGKDSRGKDCSFTTQEQVKISRGFNKFIADVKKNE